MPEKIKVIHGKNIHYHSICDDCDFAPGCFSVPPLTRDEVRRAVRRHVRLFGHSMVIESAKITRYTLDKE